jgi:SNF2 family DNA or RNA helicase
VGATSCFDAKPEVDLWISSYSQLRRQRVFFEKADFHYALLDEAQMIKNPDSKVARACLRLRSKHRLALSGTPLENRPLDVWSIFHFLMPGLLGRRASFEELCRKHPAEAVRRLRAQLAPFVLRRTKEEVLPELPPRMVISIECPLLPAQRLAYMRLTGESTDKLGSTPSEALRERPTSLFALLTRLRQVCCDPGLLPGSELPITRSGKISVLLEKLHEALGSQRKVVIFSQFVSLLDRLQKLLRDTFKEVPIHRLTGATRKRGETVQAFQEGPAPALMLVSLKAGGTGITLHAADLAFLLDPWWNPAVEEQAFDRLHRIGQERPVTIYRLVTRGTIEAHVEALKSGKAALFADTVGELGDPAAFVRRFTDWQELLELRT